VVKPLMRSQQSYNNSTKSMYLWYHWHSRH